MAEAFFNQLAKRRAQALSAGTAPADAVDSAVVEVMREVGMDISGNKPKPLTADMLEQADAVVTMGCGVEGVCPATFVETEDWELQDPEGKPLPAVRRIRDEIRAKVFELLRRVEHTSGSQTQEQM
jgi:protein-tyrosine-phosphatase